MNGMRTPKTTEEVSSPFREKVGCSPEWHRPTQGAPQKRARKLKEILKSRQVERKSPKTARASCGQELKCKIPDE
jgi:hypothetical protein